MRRSVRILRAMDTTTPTPGAAQPPSGIARDAEIGVRRCSRCNLVYSPLKSTSALRLTYCSFLCELGDLGFSISGLEHMQLQRARPAPPETGPEPEPVTAQ
jgi:hypothetical protein